MKWQEIILLVLALFILIAGVLGIREVYLYNNPEIIITYAHMESEDSYMSLPTYVIVPRSRFGNAARYDQEMRAWFVATNEVTEWLYSNFDKPRHVNSNVEIVDGKTVITYKGTAVSLDGQETEIDRTVILDFVVSKNLPENQD